MHARLIQIPGDAVLALHLIMARALHDPQTWATQVKAKQETDKLKDCHKDLRFLRSGST